MVQKYKKVSIVIPVFNEERTVLNVLKTVFAANTLSLDKEIIIVNDDSSDRTKQIIIDFSKSHKILLLNNTRNLGKGASLKKGLLQTTGDIVLIQDADLEYSPSEYPTLIRPLIDGYADVVYGSRFINANPHRVLYFYHYLANKFITLLSNLFTNLNLTDIETGYKVFKGDLIREIAPKLRSKRFGFEPEITARIARIEGIRIYEVGVSYFGRTYEEGKKINWFDGIKAIFEVIRYGFFN